MVIAGSPFDLSESTMKTQIAFYRKSAGKLAVRQQGQQKNEEETKKQFVLLKMVALACSSVRYQVVTGHHKLTIIWQ